MTIETTLERIASALENIAVAQANALAMAELQKEHPPATMPPTPSPSTLAPSAAPPPGPPVAPGAPPFPTGAAPGAPPSPAYAPGAPMPGAPSPGPATAPVQGVPTLDDIRAAFNDFSRAHQDRIQEAYAIVLKHEAKSLDQLKPATYPQVMQELKALGG